MGMAFFEFFVVRLCVFNYRSGVYVGKEVWGVLG